MKVKSTNDRVRIKKINYFLEDAVNDYIASRTLFLAQLPVQASILSSTAIEKLVKAIVTALQKSYVLDEYHKTI